MQFAKITIEANVSFNELALMFNAKTSGGLLEALMFANLHRGDDECDADCSTCTDTPSAEEQQAAPAATPFDQKSQFEKVSEMLNHSKYPLRKVSTITEKCGFEDEQETEEYLEDNFDVVFKTKRETGERLVGLASRN